MTEENIRLGDQLEQLDKELRAWGNVTKRQLLQRLLSLGLEDKIKLAKTIQRIRIVRNSIGTLSTQKEQFLTKSLSARLRKKGGQIDSIAFAFSRHGIFLEHGVGKYRPKGSSAAEAAKKPWLSVVLPPSIEDLANILEEHYADIITAQLKINIPGVINTQTD